MRTDLPEGVPERWLNLVVTISESQLSLYANGVVVANKAVDFTGFGKSASEFTLGGVRDKSGRPRDIHALLQNVRIWNRALSAKEIKQLYEEPWVGLKPISDSEEGADKE